MLAPNCSRPLVTDDDAGHVNTSKAMSTALKRSPSRFSGNTVWVWLEGLAWAAGILALTVWIVLQMTGTLGRRLELKRFAAASSSRLSTDSLPDQRLWSEKRIRAWHDTLQHGTPPPLAVLRIPRISLEVPVLEGTDDWTLNRAVGHIEDTAKPGAGGNSGIAGHRDGFFLGLKDIHAGDVLEIETFRSIEHYRVERTWVVNPEDVSVLDPTSAPAVTLVTCYPFYFVGSAPQRFIVRAVHSGTTARQQQGGLYA